MGGAVIERFFYLLSLHIWMMPSFVFLCSFYFINNMARMLSISLTPLLISECIWAGSSRMVKCQLKLSLGIEEWKWKAVPKAQLQCTSLLYIESLGWWNQFRFKVAADIQLSWLYCLHGFSPSKHSRVLYSNHKEPVNWYHYTLCTHKPQACSELLIQCNIYSLTEPLKLQLAKPHFEQHRCTCLA